MKFKVSSNDLFRRSAILVEINEKNPKKILRGLPSDYWDFIPRDVQQEEESCMKMNRRVLSPAQVVVSSFVVYNECLLNLIIPIRLAVVFCHRFFL